MANNQQQSHAQNLLIEYRPTIWRKAALEAVPGAGHKALQTCIEQINLTQKLVDTLRNNKRLGKKLYYIIHASYMTKQQPGDVVEILADIAQMYGHIPRSSYFRLRERAIRMMDEHLELLAHKKIAN